MIKNDYTKTTNNRQGRGNQENISEIKREFRERAANRRQAEYD